MDGKTFLSKKKNGWSNSGEEETFVPMNQNVPRGNWAARGGRPRGRTAVSGRPRRQRRWGPAPSASVSWPTKTPTGSQDGGRKEDSSSKAMRDLEKEIKVGPWGARGRRRGGAAPAPPASACSPPPAAVAAPRTLPRPPFPPLPAFAVWKRD